MFDFDTNQTVDSIDTVPEDFRGLYAEQDGKHSLNIADPIVKSVVTALTGASKALRTARSDADRYRSRAVDLTPLAAWGEKPEDIAAAFTTQREELEAEVAKGTKGKVDIDRIKQSMTESHTVEVGKKDNRITHLTGEIEGLLVDNNALQALQAHKGDAELLMPHVRSQIRVVEEEVMTAKGPAMKFLARVVDEDGNTRYSSTVPGQPMTINELVGGMKSDKRFGRLFDSEAPPNGGGGKKVTTQVRTLPGAPMSSVDRISKGIADRASQRR